MGGLMMRRHLITAAICLALAAPASTVSAQEGFQARYMGEMTCGGWRVAPGEFTSVNKSVLLNWVLGFLSGRSAVRGDDILAAVEISSVAAWLDDYCARNPLEGMIKAAFDLEKVLIARQRE